MTNPIDRRQAVIDGLRALADFLEANPGAPTPKYPAVSVFPNGTDEEKRAEVDRAAAVLGVKPYEEANGDHYVVDCDFGGVTYRVAAISSESMRRHIATQSYADVVQPDEVNA